MWPSGSELGRSSARVHAKFTIKCIDLITRLYFCGGTNVLPMLSNLSFSGPSRRLHLLFKSSELCTNPLQSKSHPSTQMCQEGGCFPFFKKGRGENRLRVGRSGSNSTKQNEKKLPIPQQAVGRLDDISGRDSRTAGIDGKAKSGSVEVLVPKTTRSLETTLPEATVHKLPSATHPDAAAPKEATPEAPGSEANGAGKGPEGIVPSVETTDVSGAQSEPPRANIEMNALTNTISPTSRRHKAEKSFRVASKRLALIINVGIPKDIEHPTNIEDIAGNARMIEKAIETWNTQRLEKEENKSRTKVVCQKWGNVALGFSSAVLTLAKVRFD